MNGSRDVIFPDSYRPRRLRVATHAVMSSSVLGTTRPSHLLSVFTIYRSFMLVGSMELSVV